MFQINKDIHNYKTMNNNTYSVREALRNTRTFTSKYSGPSFINTLPENIHNFTYARLCIHIKTIHAFDTLRHIVVSHLDFHQTNSVLV